MKLHFHFDLILSCEMTLKHTSDQFELVVMRAWGKVPTSELESSHGHGCAWSFRLGGGAIAQPSILIACSNSARGGANNGL